MNECCCFWLATVLALVLSYDFSLEEQYANVLEKRIDLKDGCHADRKTDLDCG